MKKIKRYNSFLESHQTEESVLGYTYAEMICKKFGITGRVKLLANLYKNDLVEIVLPAIEKS